MEYTCSMLWLQALLLLSPSFYWVIQHGTSNMAFGDALHPVRHETEDIFFRAKSHERSFTAQEMESKISTMRKRRNFQAWDESNPQVQSILNAFNQTHPGRKRPNILLILADDLGYGDLSVKPFVTEFDESKWPCVEGGILTPNLERMAKQGVIMTNFHASAPVCSPSRTSIMTGLYPWRMTAMNAFELGRDMTQRNGFLPQIPTTPEILREAGGYYTVHSGKWHLGGMREELRRARAYNDDCARPSPNQHGFEEYISELDGPESPRYTFLLRNSILHSKGHRHLLKDDVPVPIVEDPNVKEYVLSHREAEDAIAFMQEQKAQRPHQPWFMQVWFNAPHGPWERLHTGEALYSAKYNRTADDWTKATCPIDRGRHEPLMMPRWYYKTMVSAMDLSIGKLLDAVKALEIEEDTLIVFTSDNGHEMGTGWGGIFNEGKRSLMEGGVRVPAIWQWKGVFPENAFTTYFGAHTDLLPTFLHAAGLAKPANLAIDGISLLSVLKRASSLPPLYDTLSISDPELVQQLIHVKKHIPGEKEIIARYFPQYYEHAKQAAATSTTRFLLSSNSTSKEHHNSGFGHPSAALHQAVNRVFLWHKDTDPYRQHDERVQSAGHYDDLKIISSSIRGCIDRIFDMKYDPLEKDNLLHYSPHNTCQLHFLNAELDTIAKVLPKENIGAQRHCHALKNSNGGGSSENALKSIGNKLLKSVGNNAHQSYEECVSEYHALQITKIWIIAQKLIPFVNFGNHGHELYMRNHGSWGLCSVPHYSHVHAMNYTLQSDCHKVRYGCTVPEH